MTTRAVSHFRGVAFVVCHKISLYLAFAFLHTKKNLYFLGNSLVSFLIFYVFQTFDNPGEYVRGESEHVQELFVVSLTWAEFIKCHAPQRLFEALFLR